MSKPKISVVVVSYNMPRELPRTLYTLSVPYQQKIRGEDIEVIVVDNGSATPPAPYPGVTIVQQDAPTHSPIPAVNYGIQMAQGELIGVMIDGARMASPGLLYHALLASRLSPRAFVSTMAYHLGHEVQMKSVREGYNAEIEDALLDSVPWQDNGYELFNISTFAGSSMEGWFLPSTESNAIFASRALWEELGGLDERFKAPGGGLVNLDIHKKASELPDSLFVSLLGEGTFHQVHGGIATNQENAKESLLHFRKEYLAIHGEAYARPTRRPLLLGELRKEHKQALAHSMNKFFCE